MNIDIKEVIKDLFPDRNIDTLTIEAFEAIVAKPVEDITKSFILYLESEFAENSEKRDLQTLVLNTVSDIQNRIEKAKELYNL